MTTFTTPEIEDYCSAVAVALADLPVAVREDLLEDLPDHLTEVLAEGGTLRDRLGEPNAYADELRAAAGLDVSQSSGRVAASFARSAQRVGELVDRLDVRFGRALAYGRFRDLLHATRPGWWLVRGWIVAQLVCGVTGPDQWRGIVPEFHSSRAGGALILLALIVASVWAGRRSAGLPHWGRRLVGIGGIVLAVWAATFVGRGSSGAGVAPVLAPIGGGVSDIYVYDQNGNLVPGARLFDQSGNPLQLGNTYCANGDPAPGAGMDIGGAPATGSFDANGNPTPWSYPLCPNDPSPFRAGPGPAPTSPAPSASPTPSATK